MKKYWLINVSGRDGYSLMIHAEVETEGQAIDAAANADLFDDVCDSRYAFAEVASESDINQFKEWDLINEI
jgi:hypothetical protein